MFAYLRAGTTGKNDKIRYNLLNYTTTMRQNLDAGLPIFNNMCKQENNTTKTSELTTEECNSHDEQLTKNAALAEIFAKELSFLNRTIQMINLVASRYHEEKQDEAEAANFNDDFDKDDDSDNDESDIEANYEDDGCSSMLLTRTESHAMTESYHHHNNTKRARTRTGDEEENPLCNMLLVGSGKLMQGFHKLCNEIGLSIVTVNAMTSADRPITMKSIHDRNQASLECIQILYERYNGLGDSNCEDVVRNFQDLFELSKSAWSFMSLLAFSNLFRFTKGTDFEIAPINPDDAIFSNRGRPFRPHVSEAAVCTLFKSNTVETEEYHQPVTTDNTDTTDYSDEVTSVCGNL